MSTELSKSPIGTTPVLLVGGLAALLLGTSDARALSLGSDDPAEIAARAGAFDAIDGHHPAGLFGAEYRFAQTLYDFRPFLGADVTTKGATYAYGGIGLDITLCQHLVLTPNAAVGAFQRGNGTQLGSWVEFRTGAELDYRFADASRLGLTFHHMSNAGLTRRNPGEEEIGFVYALPLGLVMP